MDIFVENLFRDQDCRKFKVPSFFVRSTAPSNVEEDNPELKDLDQPTIEDVVKLLYQNSKSGGKDLGLVIAIHGYNTGADMMPDGVREYWYKPLCTYVNTDPFIKQPSGLVFLGYRWPSESMKKKMIRREARKALPVILKILLYGGIVATIAGTVLTAITHSPLAIVVSVLGTLAFSIVLSLYLLRISVYFRDSYRATMFGVSDLVELIRQLDQGLIECKIADSLTDAALYDRIVSKIPAIQSLDQPTILETVGTIRNHLNRYPDLEINPEDPAFQRFFKQLRRDVIPAISDVALQSMTERLVMVQSLEYDAAQRYWQKNMIRLSFIGHSMGGHVTTQVIRILSDVFDPRSVGRSGSNRVSKIPSARIGRVFRLGRLVLVSPDIPLLTITSGRSNFLRSALRRFEEAYLFSNEGDLALRIASTAANYFSFPAKTRTQGYRLGNLTVSAKQVTKSKVKTSANTYGIVNLDEVDDPNSHLLQYLEVNVLSKTRNERLDPASQKLERRDSQESVGSIREDDEPIADLFTYFDCTEYKDREDFTSGKAKESYWLILDDQKSPLNFFNYVRLFGAYATGKRDVHGGYFLAPFTKLLMYRLAFVGFEGLLDSLLETEPEVIGIDSDRLPAALKADLDRVRYTRQSQPVVEPSGVPPATLQESRIVALNYLSWICAQKQIQSAVSPERYQVDILGRQREDVREAILQQ